MSTDAPSQGSSPLPFLAALGVAVGGCVVAVLLTNALGYGKDTHPLRVAALTLPLFIGGAVAFWPGQKPVLRAAVIVFAVVSAAGAWAFTPSEFGGMSLVQAGVKRDQLKAASATTPTYDDLTKAGELEIPPALAASFPSLAASLQPAMTAWANAAAESVAKRYREIRPDDVTGINEVTKKAQLLTKQLPQTREAVATAERAFSDRSAEFWADELNRIPPGHFSGFLAWTLRRDAVTTILPNGDIIAKAEAGWVENSVQTSIDKADHLRLFMPQRAREELITTAKELQVLSKGSAPDNVPFRTSRQKLFTAALTKAQNDARAHIEARAYDRALTVARIHAGEWSSEATTLGPEASASLVAFREGCRYLATLAEKIGDVADFAPAPRTKP